MQKSFPNLKLSLLPTRIHKLHNLSSLLGINLYMKRDDLSGFGFGGNKTRKLDYLVADAIQNRCDALLAIGAIQSNFCRIVSAYGAYCGLKVFLLLGGGEPKQARANLFLDGLLGAEMKYIDNKDWNAWLHSAKEYCGILKKRGHKVYMLPVGGSTPVGAMGYVDAVGEIMKQEKEMELGFDTLVHAGGSGGTQAGLLCGKIKYQWNAQVLCIGIAGAHKSIRDNVSSIAGGCSALLGQDFDQGIIHINMNYMGAEYGAKTRACNEAVSLFAQKEGVFLDEVYTGKAASAIIDLAGKGYWRENQNVLFLHSGGNIQLFE
jgi:L-cysteate sulfo-lyase